MVAVEVRTVPVGMAFAVQLIVALDGNEMLDTQLDKTVCFVLHLKIVCHGLGTETPLLLAWSVAAVVAVSEAAAESDHCCLLEALSNRLLVVGIVGLAGVSQVPVLLKLGVTAAVAALVLHDLK